MNRPDDRLLVLSDTQLLVRADHLFCPVCGAVEPIHPGDGTPLMTYLVALARAADRHPARPHPDPFTARKPEPVP